MKKIADQIVDAISQVLVGKEQQIRLALACLVARGHLLIEDLPGMGKTTLAHALAQALGLSYSRVQFTSDLLPADILGVSIFDKQTGQFNFHQGPVFNQVVLADEINRSTPKTQSALLEAMAEGQVSIEGETRPLPKPFFVIATQNPFHQSGTFPLPESQLDRFLMRISLGYPDVKAERKLLSGADPRELLNDLKAVVSVAHLQQMQADVKAVKVSDSLLDYLQRLIHHSRTDANLEIGVSPRGALSALNCAKAWAFLEDRHYVIPEDLQVVLPAVWGHRLMGCGDAGSLPGERLVTQMLDAIDIIE